MAERWGGEVHREAETKNGGRKSGEGSGGEAGSMEDDRLHRGEQPPTSLRYLYGQKKKAARS